MDYKVDRAKIQNCNEDVGRGGSTFGGVHCCVMVADEMPSKYAAVRNRGYKHLFTIDGLKFYGPAGSGEKLKRALVEKKILTPKER